MRLHLNCFNVALSFGAIISYNAGGGISACCNRSYCFLRAGHSTSKLLIVAPGFRAATLLINACNLSRASLSNYNFPAAERGSSKE
jgi:hypothetical protein